MKAERKSFAARPVGDLSAGVLDPVLRKRAGMTVGLVQSWEEIVGARLGAITRPERIVWPRRRNEDDPFEPATLIVAASGMAALRLQHETMEVIGRVNAFLGFQAVGRVKIVQKPVSTGRAARPTPRALTLAENEKLAKLTRGVEDDALRLSLERLGASIMRKR